MRSRLRKAVCNIIPPLAKTKPVWESVMSDRDFTPAPGFAFYGSARRMLLLPVDTVAELEAQATLARQKAFAEEEAKEADEKAKATSVAQPVVDDVKSKARSRGSIAIFDEEELAKAATRVREIKDDQKAADERTGISNQRP
jgi:hypothetical protein